MAGGLLPGFTASQQVLLNLVFKAPDRHASLARVICCWSHLATDCDLSIFLSFRMQLEVPDGMRFALGELVRGACLWTSLTRPLSAIFNPCFGFACICFSPSDVGRVHAPRSPPPSSGWLSHFFSVSLRKGPCTAHLWLRRRLCPVGFVMVIRRLSFKVCLHASWDCVIFTP